MTLLTVPLLRNILCGLVIIAITIGGLAYMGGDLTGTAMGAQRTDRCSDKNHGSDLRSYRSDRSPLCR